MPLLAAQVSNVHNPHWVLRSLLVSRTRTLLCLVFNPLSNRLYILGANIEELPIVNLLAEHEARLQKKWDRFLGNFGSVAFDIAPLHTSFLRQKDGVSFHPARLLMLHCLLSRHVVSGNVQLPQDRWCLLCEIAHVVLHYRNFVLATPMQTTPSWAFARMYARTSCPVNRSSCFFFFFFAMTPSTSCPLNVEFISVPCMLPFCVQIYVALRKWRVHFTATLACIVLAFTLDDRFVVGKPPFVDEVRPKVVIRGKDLFVPEHYPKNASGRLQYDKKID